MGGVGERERESGNRHKGIHNIQGISFRLHILRCNLLEFQVIFDGIQRFSHINFFKLDGVLYSNFNY